MQEICCCLKGIRPQYYIFSKMLHLSLLGRYSLKSNKIDTEFNLTEFVMLKMSILNTNFEGELAMRIRAGFEGQAAKQMSNSC